MVIQIEHIPSTDANSAMLQALVKCGAQLRGAAVVQHEMRERWICDIALGDELIPEFLEISGHSEYRKIEELAIEDLFEQGFL